MVVQVQLIQVVVVRVHILWMTLLNIMAALEDRVL
jgi:hypothetical protein